MIQGLFESLNSALSASAGFALFAAFIWGVLSVLLSPCHLASIPLVVAFVGGQGAVSPRRGFALASTLAAGMLITIAAIGLATVLAGRIAGDLGPWTYYLVAAVFFLVALNLLDVLSLPWTRAPGWTVRFKGLPAALATGLLFGIVLGPCTFAYMAPVLGITFKIGGTQPIHAGSLLLLFAIGHCAVIALAGSAGGWVQRYLIWSDRSRLIPWIRRGCGILLALAGLYLLYTAA